MKKGVTTYMKGDVLEAKAFETFSQLLNQERLYVQGKLSKIFRKKGYYSKDREANIIFDLSIETTLPGAETFSLLTLLECKNYGSSVQVLDVEAFSDKIRQVGAHKGIMVTTSSFQKSALKIAQSRNIGVARISDGNEIDWINRRIDDKDYLGKIKDVEDLLSQEGAVNTPLLGIDNNFQFTSFQDLFLYWGIIDNCVPSLHGLKIPYKDDNSIERRIGELDIEDCYEGVKLNIEKLCQRMSELYDVDFKFHEPLKSESSNITLGKIEYDPLIIYINPLLRKEEARWNFTVVHEIGHLVFHSYILRKYFEHNTDNDNTGMFKTGIEQKMLQSMEIQANRFAAFVLMPSTVFLKVVKTFFIRESIQKPFLYFDDQPVNQKLVLSLLSELEQVFGVSKEAAKVRLKDLGLLKDVQDKSINGYFRKMGY